MVNTTVFIVQYMGPSRGAGTTSSSGVDELTSGCECATVSHPHKCALLILSKARDIIRKHQPGLKRLMGATWTGAANHLERRVTHLFTLTKSYFSVHLKKKTKNKKTTPFPL